ncbi:dimethylargininase [Amnibacterium sp.]|uniref:dimethylargininase n=1 Tax=Amnibacterium sp. TaxID=1872496 RepID=UPI002A1F0DB4|nr:Dimethylargininase [Amnibacterium sp.]
MLIMPLLLVRRPSPLLADGELTHLELTPVDAGLALTQWEGYAQAWRDLGWAVQEIPPADDQPDGVFVEDPLVVLGDLAVLASPGAASRRGELATVAQVIRATDLDVRTLEAPATLDGGDVLVVGRTVYVGRSCRTNEHGITGLATIVEPEGYTVVPVPVTRVLHLKSAVTALPDGTVVGFPPDVDDPGRFPDFLAMPEAGAAVVPIEDDRVLMADSVPRSAALLRDRGLDVVTVPITEFEKLEGCVTCLSVRIPAL